MAAVEPLPLVPARWMNFRYFSGFPARLSSCYVESNPRRIPNILQLFRKSAVENIFTVLLFWVRIVTSWAWKQATWVKPEAGCFRCMYQ
jgi:hypothetical protein